MNYLLRRSLKSKFQIQKELPFYRLIFKSHVIRKPQPGVTRTKVTNELKTGHDYDVIIYNGRGLNWFMEQMQNYLYIKFL